MWIKVHHSHLENEKIDQIEQIAQVVQNGPRKFVVFGLVNVKGESQRDALRRKVKIS